MVQVAVSTNKIIHTWYENERAYGCGSARFIKDYLPTLDNAYVNDDGSLEEHSRASLIKDGHRLCKICFPNIDGVIYVVALN